MREVGIPIQQTGRIDTDTPCLKCGYPLRHIEVSGDCPECGVAAGESLPGELLTHCGPRDLRRRRRGALLIAAIGIIGLPLIIFDVVMSSDVAWRLPDAFRTVHHALYEMLIMHIVAIIASIGVWMGWRMLSFEDLECREPEDVGRARRAASPALALAAAAMLIAWVGNTVVWSNIARLSWGSDLLVDYLLFALGLIAVAGVSVHQMLAIRWLMFTADRLRKRGVRRLLGFMRRVVMASILLFLVAVLVGGCLQQHAAAYITSIGLFAAGMAYTYSMLRMGLELGRELRFLRHCRSVAQTTT
jgi:MFS family permease